MPSDPTLTVTSHFRLSSANEFRGKPTVSHSIGFQGESWLQYAQSTATQRPALHILDNYGKHHSSNNIQRIGVRSQR